MSVSVISVSKIRIPRFLALTLNTDTKMEDNDGIGRLKGINGTFKGYRCNRVAGRKRWS